MRKSLFSCILMAAGMTLCIVGLFCIYWPLGLIGLGLILYRLGNEL